MSSISLRRASLASLWLAFLLAPSLAFGQSLGVIGLHGGYAEALAAAAKEKSLRVLTLSVADLNSGRSHLRGLDLILVQHLDPAGALVIHAALRHLPKDERPSLVALSPAAARAFAAADDLPKPLYDAEAERRYAERGRLGPPALLAHLGREYLQRDWQDPEADEPSFRRLFHPESPEPLKDLDAFFRWRRDPEGAEERPRAAVVVHALHLDFQQPAVVTALIQRLEAAGLCALAIVDSEAPAGVTAAPYEEVIKAFQPDVVIHTCHSTDRPELREALDCVHLHSVFFSQLSAAAITTADKILVPRELSFQVTGQELLGAIELIPTAATPSGGGRGEALQPIAAQIDLLVRRAKRWASLRRKPSAERRIAIVYFQRELGKSELLRGSATGMQLHGPRSLLALLRALEASGVPLIDPPRTEEALIARLLAEGRQLHPTDHEGLSALAARKAARYPLPDYEAFWRRTIPAAARADMVRVFGPPPGEFMVAEDQEAKALLVPHVDLGGVLLLPQPLRGEAFDDRSLHDKTVPPPHHYLAAYAWLREVWRADAILHLGTHGSEFMLPGKEAGLFADDWAALVLGDLPNINPWVLDNLAEAGVAKRRAMAVTISHLTAPGQAAGLTPELEALHRNLMRYEEQEPGALKEALAVEITKEAHRQGLELEIGLARGARLDAAAICALDERLHRLREARIPSRLHVLGRPPNAEERLDAAIRATGERFLQAILKAHGERGPTDQEAAREFAIVKRREWIVQHLREDRSATELLNRSGIVAEGAGQEELLKGLATARAIDTGLQETGLELENTLRALSGRFVRAGPAGEPERMPAALPSGRNIALVDPETLPAEVAYELGARLAEELIAGEKTFPRQVAFDLTPFATFMDYGVMEGQILQLLGVRPTWDESGRISGLKLIPTEELKRPRVDVFLSVSGYYRDLLPTLMARLDDAVQMAIDAEDPEGNPLKDRTLSAERQLEAMGKSPGEARLLARARAFGVAPGGYGSASYYYLVERSRDWEDRADLMQAYLAQVRYAYTRGAYGVHAPEAYDLALKDSSVVVRSWSDPAIGPLANKYTWFKGGSLSLAIETLSGKEPEFLLNDLRDASAASLVPAEVALQREMRERLLNPKWIRAMMGEGYAGADVIAHTTENLFGWKIMRKTSLDDQNFEQVRQLLIDDTLNLGLREWFATHNPHAYLELIETLLEIERKGYWQLPAPKRSELQALAKDFESRFGRATGLNARPARESHDNLPADSNPLGQSPQAEGQSPTPDSLSPRPSPRALKPTPTPPTPTPPTPTSTTTPWLALLALLLILCVLLGYRRSAS